MKTETQITKPLTKKTKQRIEPCTIGSRAERTHMSEGLPHPPSETDAINAYTLAMNALQAAIADFIRFTETGVLCQSGRANAAKPTRRRRH